MFLWIKNCLFQSIFQQQKNCLRWVQHDHLWLQSVWIVPLTLWLPSNLSRPPCLWFFWFFSHFSFFFCRFFSHFFSHFFSQTKTLKLAQISTFSPSRLCSPPAPLLDPSNAEISPFFVRTLQKLRKNYKNVPWHHINPTVNTFVAIADPIRTPIFILTTVYAPSPSSPNTTASTATGNPTSTVIFRTFTATQW